VTITNNRTLTISSNTLTVGGAISGAGSLTKLGAGTLALESATTNAYTGGTTNAAGVIEINGTATFGNGTGPLVLSGGYIYNDSSRLSSPIINPVLLNTNTRIFGKGTLTGTTEYRYFPFTGPFIVSPGAALYVDNLGVVSNYFDVRLQSTNGSANFASINFPIVVGDPTFDTPGAYEVLDLANDASTPTQFVNSVISGSGIVERSQVPSGTPNNAGTTVFNQQNTFSGGVLFDSGSIGFGTNSVSSGGTVLSGPVGTGLFTIGNQSGEVAYGLFAYGGPRVIDNPIYLNGASNIMVIGSYNLTFTGPVNMGGINKNWDIESSGAMTLSGQITNSSTGTGGLSKTGSGTLVFSGNNLYLGATTVRAGTLLVNNSAGSGTGTNTVNVLGGTLGGSGTIAGPVVVTNGASIAPGASVGTLTLQSGADFSSGGALVWTLGADSTNNPGTDFSQLALTGGTLNLGGTSVLTLAFTNTATTPSAAIPFWQTSRVWRIATLSGGASVAGNFASISNGTNGTYAAGTFATTTDANGLLLTFTPAAPTTSTNIPAIAKVSFSGGQLSLVVTNGSAGGNFYVVTTTNLAQAVTNWVPVATNTFAGNGSFTNSLVVTPGDPKRFYRIELP
jgi:fibronectin-binding autotransporter adhesin